MAKSQQRKLRTVFFFTNLATCLKGGAIYLQMNPNLDPNDAKTPFLMMKATGGNSPLSIKIVKFK